ncbi:helix-turn-helix domain-containing protein [Nitratireductor sp. XY-223]|uniref:helix-turn-helix transcriptional regulator n=1 Tax=Nitratireductor sp. XY-223 TaxID=2561926 RepID=UPI0010AA1254|nr:helix-turn-helix domain-containing protein [Nitratireductor sp. XY-223]
MQNDDSNRDRRTFLNSREAAEYLGLKPNTLAKMRVYGNGPKYRKHGFRVLYAIDDLNAWSEGTRRSSTSETPNERN